MVLWFIGQEKMGRPAVTTISCARCSANEKPSNICSTQHIINCQFSRWYSPLKRHTPRARILTSLPTEFLEYLTKDAIVLNPDHDNIHTDHDNHLDHTSEQSSGNSSEQDSFNRSTNLREFNQLITNTIDELGGAVVPKLNWSSPKDTTWMMPGNTMKCTCTNDVLMLLKSSDFCSHDLHHPFDDTSDYVPASDAQLDVQYELVLKEWFDLNPALEFRVFVWDNHLVGRFSAFVPVIWYRSNFPTRGATLRVSRRYGKRDQNCNWGSPSLHRSSLPWS